MPRYGRGRRFPGPSFGMRFGFGLGFCKGFPWLPRWWWTGMYGPITPYAPGWMRFGFSSGLVGRSSTGLSPAAQYLTDTGQLQQFTSYMVQATSAPTMPTGMPPAYCASVFKGAQEVAMPEIQAKMLEQQLEQIKKRLEELIM